MSEDEAAAIVKAARALRKRPSRALWIVALAIGGACALGFGLAIWTAEPAASGTAPSAHLGRDLGFAAGLLFGLVGGVGIGFSIARQSRSSASEVHSERKSP